MNTKNSDTKSNSQRILLPFQSLSDSFECWYAYSHFRSFLANLIMGVLAVSLCHQWRTTVLFVLGVSTLGNGYRGESGRLLLLKQKTHIHGFLKIINAKARQSTFKMQTCYWSTNMCIQSIKKNASLAVSND